MTATNTTKESNMRYPLLGVLAVILSTIISLTIGYMAVQQVRSLVKPSLAAQAHCITLEDCGTDSECELIEEMLARK
jgi:hypothetical protein